MTEPASPAAHPYQDARHPRPRHVAPAASLAWLKTGWSSFTRNPGVWMAISLVFFVILVALLAIPILGMVIAIIGFPVMVAGMVLGCDAQARGEPLKVDHLFGGLRIHSRYQSARH